MAFFKFRLPGQTPRHDTAVGQPPAESVDGLRRRARHRLIGAVVLVLTAVIGFPLLFDTQPRPVAVGVPISIPDRNKTKPPVLPQLPSTATTTTAAPVPAPEPASLNKAAPAASLDSKEEVIAARPPSTQAKSEAPKAEAAPKAQTPPVPKVESKPEPKQELKAVAPTTAKADDGSRALALLEGKNETKAEGKAQPVAAETQAAATDSGRFIVQIGAFADASKAREVRLKVERAGLKTYTHVLETPDGQRTRVRVGPYTSRAEADKAASKIRQLDLPAAILTL